MDREAAQMDPKNPIVYIFRAWVQNGLGNKRLALDDFDESFELAPIPSGSGTFSIGS